eukprot:2642849-Pleurochrysis_carterae.AAC.1
MDEAILGRALCSGRTTNYVRLMKDFIIIKENNRVIEKHMNKPYIVIDPVRRLLSAIEVQCRRAFFHVSLHSLHDMTYRILNTENAQIAMRTVLAVCFSKVEQLRSLQFDKEQFYRELYVLFVNSTRDQQ